MKGERRHLDIAHTILSVLFILLLIGGSLYVLSPFLLSVIWAGIIVTATWPAMEWLERVLGGRRGLAVAIMTLLLLMGVLGPLLSAVMTVIENVDTLTERVQSLRLEMVATPPEWIEEIPLAGEWLAERWASIAALTAEERSAQVAPYARTAAQWFAAKAGTVGMLMVRFLLTVLLAAILYARGEQVREGIRRFARRLAGVRGEEAAVLAGKAVRGVVLGVVITALVQTTLGGIGLFLTGLPAVTLLVAVMLILCLAQIGPLLVLAPSVAWLYWSGRPGAATVLLVFTIIAGTVDNVIRPLLIKRGVNLPLLMIFAGVVGGLIAFGIIGLFLGPVLLAVTYTLLKVWVTGAPVDADPLPQEDPS